MSGCCCGCFLVGGRKRRNPDGWQRSVQKKQRLSGQSYLAKRQKEVVTQKPREMGPRCPESAAHSKSSKMECNKIAEGDREKIFKDFWENMSWDEKRMYVRCLIDVTPVQRKRGVEDSRRSFTNFFFLKVNGIRKRVCKTMFLSTLGIGEWSALNWVKEAAESTQNTQTTAPRCDRSSEARDFIKTFLTDLPKLPSHYCRASSSKSYLEPVFQSLNDLHREYKRAAEEKGFPTLSRQVLTKEFKQQNLGLFHPKKDQCDTCCSFKTGNLPDNEWQDHLTKKEEARAAKAQDKEEMGEKTMVACMDLQAVLLCPRLKASALYYKTKLAVHNFTVYNMATHNATCYVWHEGEAGLSASEFATCVTDYLAEHHEYDEYILWSDGCGYQNRNSILSNALLLFAAEKKKVVTQKFLEKGHTQMECDSVHSVIERRLKNQEVYVPAQYAILMRKARSKPNPYQVKYIDHTFFQDFSKLRLCTSIRPGTMPGDPTVHDIRAIR